MCDFYKKPVVTDKKSERTRIRESIGVRKKT